MPFFLWLFKKIGLIFFFFFPFLNRFSSSGKSIRIQQHGIESEECADIYYLYGNALLSHIRNSDKDVFSDEQVEVTISKFVSRPTISPEETFNIYFYNDNLPPLRQNFLERTEEAAGSRQPKNSKEEILFRRRGR